MAGADDMLLGETDGVDGALEAVDEARRVVMRLYGGNLDHPALDHLEAAMAALVRTDMEIEKRPCPNEPHAAGMTYYAELDILRCPVCGLAVFEEMGG